jgi:hypothetical protein
MYSNLTSVSNLYQFDDVCVCPVCTVTWRPLFIFTSLTMCVCVSSMYSNLTSVSNLYHIQSKSCSKLGRTTLRLITLAGQKHGRATKLRVPIITGFSFCVSFASNCCKNVPTVSHSGNTKNAYFWCVMFCLCVIHSGMFESTRLFWTAGSHSSKKKTQHWRREYLESSLFYTLFYLS